jgi:hypothetical protein
MVRKNKPQQIIAEIIRDDARLYEREAQFLEEQAARIRARVDQLRRIAADLEIEQEVRNRVQ